MNPADTTSKDAQPPGGAAPRKGGFLHVGGGLGDVARRFYLTDTYERLAGIEVPTFVLCFSHNPSALEFFRFHPNHRNLIVCDLGHIYMSLLHDPSFDNRGLDRALFALCGFAPEDQLAKPRAARPIRQFHAPDAVETAGGHVVIHPFGRGWGDWPAATCDLVRRALRAVPPSIRIFVISADYTAADGRRKVESFPCELPNVTVLKNLSAPATFSLVASASRFIGTMSSLTQVAALEGIPAMILHPERCKDFKPPFSHYSKTVWQANGAAVAYDVCPPAILREHLERFLHAPSVTPIMREEFASFASVPVL